MCLMKGRICFNTILYVVFNVVACTLSTLRTLSTCIYIGLIVFSRLNTEINLYFIENERILFFVVEGA